MTRMIRKQIYLDPQQDQALKKWAREKGITESDVLRRSLVTFMTERQEKPLRLPVDHDAWQHTMTLIRNRARRFNTAPSVPDTENLWTRDATYEEESSAHRFAHFSR